MAKRNQFCPVCQKKLYLDTSKGEFVYKDGGKLVWCCVKCYEKVIKEAKGS